MQSASFKWMLCICTALLFTACDVHQDITPRSQDEALTLRASNFNFTAQLKGDHEVPPVATNAAGVTIVKISQDETSVYYKLNVSNITDVTAAHFHRAPAGSNGGVVAFLYTAGPMGPQNGTLAEGTLTAADVVGTLAGDMAGLIAEIRAGNIYVNVHTLAVGSGEVRGQVD